MIVDSVHFKNIPCYQEEKTLFAQMIKRQQLPSALLLISDPGGVALSMAIAFVQLLHCEKKNSCGNCPTCHRVNKWIEPNVQLLLPLPASSILNKLGGNAVVSKKFSSALGRDISLTTVAWEAIWKQSGKNLQISVEQARSLKQAGQYAAERGTRRTALIWQPERLHPSASNALLKLLEEPASDQLFLLVSHQPNRLLPTLRSRLWSYRFPQLTDQQLGEALERKYPMLSQQLLKKIGKLSKGGWALALQRIERLKDAVDSEIVEVQYLTFLTQWLRALYAKQWAVVAQQAVEWHKWPLDQQKQFLCYAIQAVNKGWKSHWKEEIWQDSWPEERAFLERFSKTIGVDKQVILIVQLGKWQKEIERHLYEKLSFLHHSLAIAQLFN